MADELLEGEKEENTLTWAINNDIGQLVQRLKDRQADVEQAVPLIMQELQLAGLDITSQVMVARSVSFREHKDELKEIESDLIKQAAGKGEYMQELIDSDKTRAADRKSRVQKRAIGNLKAYQQFLEMISTHPVLEQKSVTIGKVVMPSSGISPEDGKSRLSQYKKTAIEAK